MKTQTKETTHTPTPEAYIQMGAILTDAGNNWPRRSPTAEELFRAVNAYDQNQKTIAELGIQLQSLYDLVCNIQSNLAGANLVMREAENVGCDLDAVRVALARATAEGGKS